MEWNEELQSWIHEAAGEHPLIGISPQIYNLAVWFGDLAGRSVILHYPTDRLPQLMIDIPLMHSNVVTRSSGVILEFLPEGWIKLIPGGHEIRQTQGAMS